MRLSYQVVRDSNLSQPGHLIFSDFPRSLQGTVYLMVPWQLSFTPVSLHYSLSSDHSTLRYWQPPHAYITKEKGRTLGEIPWRHRAPLVPVIKLGITSLNVSGRRNRADLSSAMLFSPIPLHCATWKLYLFVNTYSQIARTGDRGYDKIMLFWHMAPCSLVDSHRFFGGTFCIHIMSADVE
jgi:hypothetical protein